MFGQNFFALSNFRVAWLADQQLFELVDVGFLLFNYTILMLNLFQQNCDILLNNFCAYFIYESWWRHLFRNAAASWVVQSLFVTIGRNFISHRILQQRVIWLIKNTRRLGQIRLLVWFGQAPAMVLILQNFLGAQVSSFGDLAAILRQLWRFLVNLNF